MKKILLPILIPSCSFINNSEVANNSSGEVKVSFKFPKKSTSFVVKAIPEETDSIEIKVLGKRLNEEATKTVKKADADPKTGEVKLNLKKLLTGS